MPEHVQLQRRCLAQPGGMRRMVSQVIAGQAMHQHVQTAPVLVQPWNEGIEICAVECQLAAPVRMRPNLALMHATDDDAKKLARPLAQGARLRYRCWPEIDMGVVAVIKVFGSLGHNKTKDSKFPAYGAVRRLREDIKINILWLYTAIYPVKP